MTFLSLQPSTLSKMWFNTGFNRWFDAQCKTQSFVNRARGTITVLAGARVAYTSPLVHRVAYTSPLMAFTSLCTLMFVLAFPAGLAGQTLFAPPDTSPNFASYRYLEECENSALRLTDEIEIRKNPIWADTLNFAMQQVAWTRLATTRRPDTAIKAASQCLARFNADTVHIRGLPYARYILNVLLIAHRDQDAERFAQRVLDSVRRQPEWDMRDAFEMLIDVFGSATPVRLNTVKRYYAEQLALLKNDSLRRTVLAATEMSQIANRVGDTALFEEIAWSAIRTLDSIPADQRIKQFSDMFLHYVLVGNLRRLTKQEAFDSMAISTTAYKSWEANTIQARIYGNEKRKTAKEIDLSKLPDLVGEHYYVASNTSTSPATYAKRGAVPRSEIPVRGRVNLVYGLPSYCHAEGVNRKIEYPKHRSTSAYKCVQAYAMLRRLKQRIPDFEITIVSSTYGTVGALGPLKPVDEADTLAKLWLGWHHIPARLVVEELPFFKVPEPDGRRIDLPTPFADSLGVGATFPMVIVTDQDGVRIGLLNTYGNEFETEDNIRLLETLARRGRK